MRGGLAALAVAALAPAPWERERDRILQLGARRRLHEQVTTFPGLHLAELARGLDMDPNHAKYHLDRLERAGLVASRHERGFLLYFPKEETALGLRDAVAAQDKAVLAALRRPVPLHIALLLLERGRTTHAQLLEDVGVAHGTLHYHLKRMEDSGILASVKEGRERWYSLTDRDTVERLLTKYRPPNALVAGFLDAWEGLQL